MSLELKKIGAFLKDLTDLEYGLLEHYIGMRNNIQGLIEEFDLTKEQVCEAFGITKSQYDNFTLGNYNYTLMDGAKLNALYRKLKKEKLEKNVPFKVAEETK